MSNSNKVRIVATKRTFQEAPFFVAPKFDPQRSVFVIKGTEWKAARNESDGVYRTSEYPVELAEDLSYKFKHLQIFDKSLPQDKALLDILEDSGFLATNKNAVHPSKHRFYIEDKEAEAAETLSKAKSKRKAFAILDNMSLSDIVDFARLKPFNINVSTMTNLQVEAAIVDLIEKNPQVFLNAASDPDKQYRVLLYKLTSSNILHHEPVTGKITYNGEVIGMTEESVIAYIKDPSNAKIITEWLNMTNTKFSGKIAKEEAVVEESGAEFRPESPVSPGRGRRKE